MEPWWCSSIFLGVCLPVQRFDFKLYASSSWHGRMQVRAIGHHVCRVRGLNKMVGSSKHRAQKRLCRKHEQKERVRVGGGLSDNMQTGTLTAKNRKYDILLDVFYISGKILQKRKQNNLRTKNNFMNRTTLQTKTYGLNHPILLVKCGVGRSESESVYYCHC